MTGRLRVALLAEGDERAAFRDLLERQGMNVVLDRSLAASLPTNWNGAEVLLVGAGDRCDRSRLDTLLKSAPVPVLLTRGGMADTEIWRQRLLGKLQTLAAHAVPVANLQARRERPGLSVVPNAAQSMSDVPLVVVLGGSIGGPKAVARFLSALPSSLPVAFLLAQHISETFQHLLVEQLDRCSDWQVALMGNFQTLHGGQVWLVPAECRIEVAMDGMIKRLPETWASACRPAIDDVLSHASKVFGSRCGAILFSGRGKDGVAGCVAVAEKGGFVWAQSSASCVIANLPEAVRHACDVELSGSPEDLANALSARCQAVSASIN